jgi:tetratricopeptide (TPR) repeat protein
MNVCRGRVLVAAFGSLLVLSGCETSTKLGDLVSPGKSDDSLATGSLREAVAGDPIRAPGVAPPSDTLLPASTPVNMGQDAYDDLNLGKKQYRAGHWGLAEQHFRRAVEAQPNDAEAWVGLAASYDRLKRFDLADRAYKRAIELVGPTPELLNNQGFSYMLRGDYVRARAILMSAQAKDPGSVYVQNNLDLLDKSARKRKGIE